MSTEKIKLDIPVIVEGKYDKITLSSYLEATVLTTDGFGIFNSKEKQALIKRLCKDGVILLTDSDGGGKQIRSFLLSILPREKIINLYTPEILGKEKRKTHPSKAGVLGVEGMKREVIERLFSPFASGTERPRREPITKTDMYLFGLSGTDGASTRRDAVAKALSLPSSMTPNALLEAMNLLIGKEELAAICERINSENENNCLQKQE